MRSSRRWRTCLVLVLVVLACMLQPLLLPGQSPTSSRAEAITVDAQAPAHPLPHFWETTFGSGRAVLALRSSYRRDLREVKRATGFEYVRFHAVFHDEVGLYSLDERGNPVYNYSYIDQIYDGLLEAGVRPFVELSFMPRDLASTDRRQEFWYHPYISPPKDWNRWGDMVEHLARHLVGRYGLDEVSQWYFEVWNEPNIGFWAGEPKQETYFHLYDVAARALKRVSPRLRVGGPATAQAAWVPSFLRHCADDGVPVDFVSTHVYANDTAENVFGTRETIPRDEMVYRAVAKVHEEVKASPRPQLPIVFSEFNASYMNEVDVTDSPFMGPWLANTIRQCDGLVDVMAYWTFSDVFEEQGVVKTPFYGGFGLIAVGDIPKATFNDFRLLHMLGNERLALDSPDAIATRRADGSLAVAVWNYAPPGEGGTAKKVELTFQNLTGTHRAYVWVVDGQHGSPLATWEAMGKPPFPTREQQSILRQAGQLPAPEVMPLGASRTTLTLQLAPHGLALVEVTE
ncbi:MAG: glycosyl hydrolase family 39 [Acidobacteriia bacterium]|nr:glycosyl hydrolase family 39 [Terriglobia bacterium]